LENFEVAVSLLTAIARAEDDTDTTGTELCKALAGALGVAFGDGLLCVTVAGRDGLGRVT
jgi:hypothetical protein